MYPNIFRAAGGPQTLLVSLLSWETSVNIFTKDQTYFLACGEIDKMVDG